MKSNLLRNSLLLTLTIYSLHVFARENKSQINFPLCFIENTGQIKDQSGNKRNDIDFKIGVNGGLNVFVGKGRLYYQFAVPAAGNSYKPKRLKTDICDIIQSSLYNMSRLDMALEGTNPNATLIAGDQLNYTEHHVISGNNNESTITNSYNKITYKDIYPGIDWVLYFNAGHLEYDFIVYPNGNAGDIKIKYNGQSDLLENSNGITVVTPMGNISDHALHIYSMNDHAEIEGSYCYKDHEIGFNVGHSNGTIVIDPTLDWGTYYGGANAQGTAIAPGSYGIIYISGYTTSAADIATTGAYQTTYGGDCDAYLAKFDSSGNMLWSTYYGGNNVDQNYGMVADTSGNVYITGITSSTNGIATAGTHQGGYGGGECDAYLAKFNSSGNLVWGTYFGGSGPDIGWGAAFDKTSGDIYITGYTYSTDSIATPGTYKTNGGGPTYADGFIAKFNPSGNIVWSTYWGGNDDDEPNSIACDDSGYVYMAGQTASTDSIATPGAFQHTFQDDEDGDGFLVKFTPVGALLWGTYYGAGGSNELEAMTCDSAGNAYMTGSTSCPDSIATPGSMQSSLIGAADAYLVKFNSSGTIQWGTYYGLGGDGGDGVSCDNEGNIYLTGSTNSTSGIVTTGAYQSVNAGGGDAFVSRFNSAGELVWATYYGGAALDDGIAVVSNNNDIYVTGFTKSDSGIATQGAYDSVYGASTIYSNAFLAKFGAGPTAGINKLQITNFDIIVYPNPATSIVNVSWERNNISYTRISIIDPLGHVFYTNSLISSLNQISIPVIDLQEGIYFCVIENDGEKQYSKFTVTR